MWDFALPHTKDEHFQFIREGFSNKWRTATEEKFCTNLLHFIQSEGMKSDADVDMAFEKIYHTCLAEIDPNLTFKECYVTFMVLKDGYWTFKFFLECVNGVFDIHAKTVYLDEDDGEEAFEFWPLAHHYCNNPKPLWETWKIIFEPLRLYSYLGEDLARARRNSRKLDQLLRDYQAEERRMAARRKRGN
ncbi:5-methyltetrahydropteroyltriglutamate--homocysteine methyltransferase [Striga asiatica]|uniref:5-methyltetrahydropteroyltriglutamate--homocysteine methyltransferase n=1 Tax=Striga asiatica TaxID=4170 RepID=A0A5A7RAA7_STRAF|nr:5-methyltetrahydropteroyltriglutamate--homocysteine methyltransferase [Striga asiatica]